MDPQTGAWTRKRLCHGDLMIKLPDASRARRPPSTLDCFDRRVAGAGSCLQNLQRAPRRVFEADLLKLKLDLHDIYNRGQDIDRALREVIDEAVRTKATVVEIIPGKGSGQLKKRVLRFLDEKEIKAKYHRVEKDSREFRRVFVHFRWK